MLTPVDIQNKAFKGGIGFDKKDVESFMVEVSLDYEQLYRSNIELTDKVTTLNESLQHYRSIEDSMQRALRLSEKTAEETINAANDKARQINLEAENKAEAIVADAKKELQELKDEIYRLQKQHKTFKKQFTKILQGQLKIMAGEVVEIDLGPDFEPSAIGLGNYFNYGLGGDSGLGGLNGSGGYVGASMYDSGRERTNQEPMFDRGTSLNMDPFSDAMNGGGRFSKQTGKAYNGNSKKRKSKKDNTAGKTPLNVKDVSTASPKVKRDFTKANVPNQDIKESAVMPDTENNSANTTTQGYAQTPTTDIPTYTSYTEQPQTDVSHTTPNDMETSVTDTSSVMNDMQNDTTFTDTTQTNVTFEAEVPVTESVTEMNETQFTGEVEEKVNESTMLDSEDNYDTGFDFFSDDENFSFESDVNEDDGTYSGEVEEKVNESTMLDSEDNYGDAFDFVVDDNSVEDEIPTILSNISSGDTDTSTSSDFATNNDNDDIFVGDVEEQVKKSNLIGNEDDDDIGFNFL